MSKWDKFRLRLLSARSDNAINFAELCSYLELIGFILRPARKSSHHIYTKNGVLEIINLQPQGNMAKPYQVKQVREIIERYGL